MIQYITYAFYLFISVYITVIVGKRLYDHGQVYTCEVFEDVALNLYVNKLLLVGYYLLNIGYAFFVLVFIPNVDGVSEMISVVSTHAGMNVIGLGFMHYFNLTWLYLYKRIKLNQTHKI